MILLLHQNLSIFEFHQTQFSSLVSIFNLKIYIEINCFSKNWPLWPSGLICHVSNSSRDILLGPRFEFRLGHINVTDNQVISDFSAEFEF